MEPSATVWYHETLLLLEMPLIILERKLTSHGVIVREHVLQRKNDEVLQILPEAIILGNVTLSGDAWKRQLLLGHSAYIAFAKGWRLFNGLSRVLPDGKSAEYYWMIFAADNTVGDPKHWLKAATPEEIYKYSLDKVQELEPKFREIIELAKVEDVKGMVVGAHIPSELGH